MSTALRVFWSVACLPAIAFALAWWWLLPHGFPITHSRFFLHDAMPAMVLAACGGGIAALWTERTRLAGALLVALPSALIGSALGAAALYPSARLLALVGLAPGIAGVASVLASFRKRAAVALGCGAALGIAGGAVWARAWRAGAPSTSPAGAFEPGPEMAPAGALYLPIRERVVWIDASLDFQSCSPDRFLTVLVYPPHCPPVTQEVHASSTTSGATNLLALTELNEDVFSHLNSFSQIEIQRLRDTPFVSFSPAPEARIEIVQGRYPIGAPYRMASLGEDGVLRVVEASSGEKGPFRVLASGPLRRGEPLTLTLWDGDAPLVDVTFDDFSAQASTDLSPTAGWGFPQNAIEMQRNGDRATIFLTLASTSVGRGFDTVGHHAGTYRNRVTMTPR